MSAKNPISNFPTGYVTHILRKRLVIYLSFDSLPHLGLSGFHAQNSVRGAHLALLEKAMSIFALPKNGIHRGVHRRVDLIFAAPETYWTAIIGW